MNTRDNPSTRNLELKNRFYAYFYRNTFLYLTATPKSIAPRLHGVGTEE